jgi:acetolactate synthase-1/2/3 large subunit
VCTAIARVLEEAGITMVFGMHGGHTGRIFEALSKFQNTIRTVMVREESLGGAMAEAYARLTGKPGVLMGQGAWVLGNGIIGTLEAQLSSTPMILLTEFSDTPGYELHAPFQSGTAQYGLWDARMSFKGITKQVFEARDPTTAVHAVQLAVKHALSGQPGPVTVLFSLSGLIGNASPESKPILYRTSHYLPTPPSPCDPGRIAAAAKTIMAAKNPVVIAGNGVRIARARPALARFAEATGIPVVTTATGKSVMPEDHPLSLGTFGNWGNATGNMGVAEADVLIVVGSKLGASDTARERTVLLDPRRQTFIQIDIEPRNASWVYPAEHSLIGDAGMVLDQLREAIGTDKARADKSRQRVADFRKRHGYFDDPDLESNAVPILPQRIIGEMHKNLPADCIVTGDGGVNRILTTHFFQTRNGGEFLQASGAGAMGYAIPAAMAAKLVHPERTAVAVVGDGGFAMTMNGLLSAVQHGINIIVIIFNNGTLAAVAHDTGAYATDFGDVDYAAIARGMACNGVRVTDPNDLVAAIRDAVKARKPSVIDVITSPVVSFRSAVSPPLKYITPDQKTS